MSITKGVRRLAWWMAVLAVAGMVCAPLMPTGFVWELWLGASMPPAEWEQLASHHELVAVFETTRRWLRVDAPSDFTNLGLIAGWLVAVALTIPTMLALWNVRRTLLETAAGRPFSPASVRAFRRFAWATLAAVIATIATPTLSGTVLSALSPEIPNTVAIGVGMQDVRGAFSALLLVAVAHMFAEARRLAEDVEGLL